MAVELERLGQQELFSELGWLAAVEVVEQDLNQGVGQSRAIFGR